LKNCSSKDCKQENPQALGNFAPDNRRKDGLQSQCRDCQRQSVKVRRQTKGEKVRARDRAYWQSKKEHFIEERRKLNLRKYWPGSTKEEAQQQWNLLFEAQGGHCATCPATEDLRVDHCHITLRVRGLLCDACNLALGLVKENPETLRNLSIYKETK
jgi:hypothetical protein